MPVCVWEKQGVSGRVKHLSDLGSEDTGSVAKRLELSMRQQATSCDRLIKIASQETLDRQMGQPGKEKTQSNMGNISYG
jgi:hypothetical protein